MKEKDEYQINSYNSFNSNIKNKDDINNIKSSGSIDETIASYNKMIVSQKDCLNRNNVNIKSMTTDKGENIKNKNNNKIYNPSLKFKQEKSFSSMIFEKLPKIQKYPCPMNALEQKYISCSNPLLFSNSKPQNNNPNISLFKKQIIFNDYHKNKIKKRLGSPKISNTVSENNIQIKKNSTQSEPKFGNMKEYLILPDFFGEEPISEMIFNEGGRENNSNFNPEEEEQLELEYYINTQNKLSNLIYLKIPLSKEGRIETQNLINVRKLDKDNKNEEDEEESVHEVQKSSCENKDTPENNIIQEEKEPSSAKKEEEEEILVKPKKFIQYISISEYPGNYRKVKKEEEESTVTKTKIYINRRNNIYNDNILPHKDSMNINLNKQIPDKNFLSKSINIMQNEPSCLDNKTELNNNLYNSAINKSLKEEESYIQINTIYGGVKPFYQLKGKDDRSLIFESRFECGNLLCAFKTADNNKYELCLQNDTNTTGYIQWFFFRVSNTKKGDIVNLTLINMQRPHCLYKNGLKIMTYSKMQAKNENLGWHRDGTNFTYYKNNLFVYNENKKKKKNLFSLSFDYEFKYDNDTIYFANCLPYLFTKLNKEISLYEKKQYNFYFMKKIITPTLGNNDLVMLNITSKKSEKVDDIIKCLPQLNKRNNNLCLSNSFKIKVNDNDNSTKNSKKAVILIGRQHPGETVGSYVIKGCTEFLMGDSDEAVKLRELYDFYIFPMMNPDGVVVGNSRSSFAGCDLNRRWSKPNDIFHREIFQTKSFILQIAEKQNVSFIIDFHGHFTALNSLFYCNYKKDKKLCSLFPYLCCKLSNIISFEQTSFAMPKYKNSTERLSLFRELNDTDNNCIVALETSFFGGKKKNETKNFYFNSKTLSEIGRDICLGMLTYHYQFENIPIEKELTNKEKYECLKIDMKDYLTDLEKCKEEEEIKNLTESESEPSVDNLDKKEIVKLMPVNNKKKKKKIKGFNSYNNNNNHMVNCKIKKIDNNFLSKKKRNHLENTFSEKNKNIVMDIELYHPTKEKTKIKEEKKNKVNPINKTSVITSISVEIKQKIKLQSKSRLNIKNIDKNEQSTNKKNNKTETIVESTESNIRNAYTQTEEIFFKMNWTFFIGKYKILAGRRYTSNKLPNISTIPLNYTGQVINYQNNSNFLCNRRKELYIQARFRNLNISKFGNIFMEERLINHYRNKMQKNIIKRNKIEVDKHLNIELYKKSNI